MPRNERGHAETSARPVEPEIRRQPLRDDECPVIAGSPHLAGVVDQVKRDADARRSDSSQISASPLLTARTCAMRTRSDTEEWDNIAGLPPSRGFLAPPSAPQPAPNSSEKCTPMGRKNYEDLSPRTSTRREPRRGNQTETLPGFRRFRLPSRLLTRLRLAIVIGATWFRCCGRSSEDVRLLYVNATIPGRGRCRGARAEGQ